MANKQKLQKNVSKKAQGEKTQRNVHIIKHFQPNVAYNKLHRSCDLPEVNADIDSTETLTKIKRSIISQAPLNKSKIITNSSTLKPNIPSQNERKRSTALDARSTPLLPKLNTGNRLKSNTQHSLTSGSSSTKESRPLKSNKAGWAVGLRPNNKQKNLKKPLLKSSLTNSSTSSKENYSTKAETIQTYKSNSFSVGIIKKDKTEHKTKLKSVNDRSEMVEDLKKEIRANQIRRLGIKDNNYLNSRRERVQSLREEIKKLIDTNTDNKRKHLTELTTEIAEFRANKNVLVYNVDIETENDKPVKEIQEISPLNENERIEVTGHSSRNESTMKRSEKFCEIPVEAPEAEDHQIPVEHVLSSTNNQASRRIIQVETQPIVCQKIVTTEDVVHSKIEETNKLIENLQKTLDEIRHRTIAIQSIHEIKIVGNETEKAAGEVKDETESKSEGSRSEQEFDGIGTERESDGSRTEQESDGENDAASLSDVAEIRSAEADSSPLHQQALNTTPEEAYAESEPTTVEQVKISDGNVDVDADDGVVTPDIFRPKTRRTCDCIEKATDSTDKFRTAPGDESKEIDDFDILQAKLDAIVESTESDSSHVREDKSKEAKIECPRVSFVGDQEWLFRDFTSVGQTVDTQNVSTAMQDIPTAACSSQTEKNYQPTLVRKSTETLEILPDKKPQLGLSMQLLPPLSIRSRPVAQQIINFFIDQLGRTTVTFIDNGRNVGFFEMQSSSLNSVFSSQYSENTSMKNKEHDKKPDGTEPVLNSVDLATLNQSTENKIHRLRKHKSFSDSDMFLKTESADQGERNKILQSYQLYDNRNQHDPGVLGAVSQDIISAIDENIYKTFINPKGFQAPQYTASTYSAHRPKTANMEKMSSVKSLQKISASDFRQKKERISDKLVQTVSKSITERTESDSAPKLYNIGLYDSRSTQMLPFDDISLKQSKESRKETARIPEVKEKTEMFEHVEEKESEKIEKVVENEEEEEEIELIKEIGGKGEYLEEKEIGVEEIAEIEEEKEGKETESMEKEQVEFKKLLHDALARKFRKELEKKEIREREEKEKCEKDGKEKRGYGEVVSVGSTSSSASDEIRARGSVSFERFSVSLSYSTDESITTDSSIDVSQKTSKLCKSSKQAIDRNKEFASIEFDSRDEQRSDLHEHSKSGSYAHKSRDTETFKNLKEKITKEHNFDVDGGSESEESSEEDDDVHSYVAVPTFISGLVETSTANLKRVIPNIRKSVRVAKSEMRTSVLEGRLAEMFASKTADLSPRAQPSSEKNSRTSPPATSANTSRQSSLLVWRSSHDDEDEKEVENHNYQVMPVHVQGDSIAYHRRMTKAPECSPAPLQVGRSGRYPDEEDLFCESNCSRYENSLHQRRRAVHESLYKTKFNLDSSNSDTMTGAERALSEGEVRCGCSVSIGEIHVCRKRRSPSRLRRHQSFFAGEPSAGIRKRRTYFNNWVTYYVNKNVLSVNDSSSTS